MGFEADRLIEDELLTHPSQFENLEQVDRIFEGWISRDRLNGIRKKFVWTDKQGDKHKLADIDDMYLQNTINFLKRVIAATPEYEDQYLGDEHWTMSSNEQYINDLERTIDFLEWEQKQRAKEVI